MQHTRRRLVLKINVCDSSGWDSHGWIFVSHLTHFVLLLCLIRLWYHPCESYHIYTCYRGGCIEVWAWTYIFKWTHHYNRNIMTWKLFEKSSSNKTRQFHFGFDVRVFSLSLALLYIAVNIHSFWNGISEIFNHFKQRKFHSTNPNSKIIHLYGLRSTI